MTDYPDFTVIARLKGEYAGLEKAVALDSEGALQALLYGTYSGGNKKILIDTDGNVRMNLYAQDLDEMVNRFKYGAPLASAAQLAVGASGYTTLYDISGKGYIYYIDINLDANVSHNTDKIKVTLDGTVFIEWVFNYLEAWNYSEIDDLYITLRQYDDIEFRYRVNLLRGFTFESSIKIEYYNSIADTPSPTRLMVYTLI